MSGREPMAAFWIRKAEADFLNIRNNLAAQEIPWDTVCFHAQQAAEKLLKAFLVAHGRPAPRVHDLVALLASCVEIEPRLAVLEGDCRRLTTFGTAVRYPTPWGEPTPEEGRELVEAAQRVREKVLEFLEKANR